MFLLGSYLLLHGRTKSITHRLLLLRRPAKLLCHEPNNIIENTQTPVTVFNCDPGTTCKHVIRRHCHLLTARIDHLRSSIGKIVDEAHTQLSIALDQLQQLHCLSAIIPSEVFEDLRAETKSRSLDFQFMFAGRPACTTLQGQVLCGMDRCRTIATTQHINRILCHTPVSGKTIASLPSLTSSRENTRCTPLLGTTSAIGSCPVSNSTCSEKMPVALTMCRARTVISWSPSRSRT